MSTSRSKVEPSFVVNSDGIQHHDRKRVWGSFRAQLLWYRLRTRLLNTLSIWSNAFRSAVGHIQIQDTKEPPSVNFGRALTETPDKRLEPNIRTDARTKHTQMLWAKYPWVDTVDMRMFLMGFDAGEQWRDRSPHVQDHIEADTSNEIPLPSSKPHRRCK